MFRIYYFPLAVHPDMAMASKFQVSQIFKIPHRRMYNASVFDLPKNITGYLNYCNC